MHTKKRVVKKRMSKSETAVEHESGYILGHKICKEIDIKFIKLPEVGLS